MTHGRSVFLAIGATLALSLLLGSSAMAQPFLREPFGPPRFPGSIRWFQSDRYYPGSPQHGPAVSPFGFRGRGQAGLRGRTYYPGRSFRRPLPPFRSGPLRRPLSVPAPPRPPFFDGGPFGTGFLDGGQLPPAVLFEGGTVPPFLFPQNVKPGIRFRPGAFGFRAPPTR